MARNEDFDDDALSLDDDEELREERIVRVSKEPARRRISPPRFDDEPPAPRRNVHDRISRVKTVEEVASEGQHVQVTSAAIQTLYDELHALDREFILTAVAVKGCDQMTAYQVEKIFAAFRPYRVEMSDENSAVVHFLTRSDAAAMMVDMTSKLRRIRTKKLAEDGELRESSDEEEGQVKDEAGDDVNVVTEEHLKGKKSRERDGDVIEINVDDVNLPEGRWRVVTKHVPEKRLILARFATEAEIDAARNYRGASEMVNRKRRVDVTDDGFTYTWSHEKARPGLNVFDKEGKELEWDYEHDTRFFENPDYEDLDTSQEEEDKRMMEAWPAAAKVRGRGAKSAKFFSGGAQSSLHSDAPVPKKKLRPVDKAGSSVFDEPDDDWGPSPNDDPTPQPWDKPVKKGNIRSRISFH